MQRPGRLLSRLALQLLAQNRSTHLLFTTDMHLCPARKKGGRGGPSPCASDGKTIGRQPLQHFAFRISHNAYAYAYAYTYDRGFWHPHSHSTHNSGAHGHPNKPVPVGGILIPLAPVASLTFHQASKHRSWPGWRGREKGCVCVFCRLTQHMRFQRMARSEVYASLPPPIVSYVRHAQQHAACGGQPIVSLLRHIPTPMVREPSCRSYSPCATSIPSTPQSCPVPRFAAL